jgi:hypothetical protein
MKLSLPFLHTEWREVVDAWQLDSWEAYRDVARLGRKTRLPEKQGVALWEVFARIRAELKKAKLTTLEEIYSHLTADLAGGRPRPYDFVIADEAQDVSVAQLRLLAVFGDDPRRSGSTIRTICAWSTGASPFSVAGPEMPFGGSCRFFRAA